MDNKFLTISRKWNNPTISINITGEGITINMSMEDFSQALHTELGILYRLVVSKEKLDKSITSIVDGMKSETTKVM